MCIMIMTEIVVQSSVLAHYLLTSILPWHIFVQGNEWPLLTENKTLGEILNLITQDYSVHGTILSSTQQSHWNLLLPG